ncbi:MAG: alanine racemase [Actinobacteria bacterium]|nr:alanine racemase [Actinomycetota bacterium]
MTVRLTVQRAAWRKHVATTAQAYGAALEPVVKGNGYGFGRALLHQIAAELAPNVCVGTIHELADVPAGARAVVLTPALQTSTIESAANGSAVLTVGSTAHVAALAGWSGEVMVKLASSMRRFGATADELPAVLAAAREAGLGIAGFGLHLPTAGDDRDRIAEIEAWLPRLPAETSLWVSHLQPTSMHALVAAHPQHTFRIRVGTALWHGVPRLDIMQLRAEVLDTRPIRVGQEAGYRQTPAACDGTLVVIGAGSTHGIAPRGDLSPFHFARNRMAMHEHPYMHTSLVIVRSGIPCPQVGEWVDVQSPLITTNADAIEWQ